MASGRDRGSPSAGTESPEVRGAGDQSVTPTVDDLLMRAGRGDTRAFASVCDQVSGAVYGMVRRMIEDQARAERIAADVLVEVWRSAPQFSPAESSGLNWVMSMARRMAMTQAGTTGNQPAGLTPPGTAGVIAEQTARDLLAHRGLASLPGPQQEAVLLACCGYTCPQIADLMGVSGETVAERIRDGLLSLGSG
jgi:RNA polymerase sigma-70 factor (ECF subfamily)